MVLFLIAAGLIGAAVGGSAGYFTGGLTGAALGAGVGALAGASAYGLAYALTGPHYRYPYPYLGYPGYGYWHYPVLYPTPQLYYTTAF